MLDLATTDDTLLLAELLAGAGGEDVVLDPVAEVGYQRAADRFNAMWADSSGLDRILC